MKLLHIADLHLGKKFEWLGKAGKDHRERLRRTFGKIIDLALKEGIGALLVAGDLFDTPSPYYREDILCVREGFSRLADAGVDIFLIPGTHDKLMDGKYLNGELDDISTLHVFKGENWEGVRVKNSDIAVYGRGVAHSGSDYFAGFCKIDAKFHIVLAHGSADIPGEVDFTRNELRKLDVDYIALGHWHGHKEVLPGKAVYPGSPEVLEKDEKEGGVIWVEVDGGRLSFEHEKIGESKAFDCSVEVREDTEFEDVVRKIEKVAGESIKQAILRIKLLGKKTPLITPSALEGRFREKCLFVEVEDRRGEDVRADELERLGRIAVEFVGVLRKELQEAKDEGERRVIEEAMRLGLRALRGEEII